jgi:hypothetical protein
MAAPEEWLRAKHVSFGDIRRGLEGATLAKRSELLDFIRHHVDKIRPQPDTDWLYDQMSSYLLECISRGSVEHRDGEVASIHSPFEAAHELVVWFNWYLRAGDVNPNMIRPLVDRIEAVFRDGDNGVRNCIETGFLEHVLETPNNRQYFTYWAHDPLLEDSYTEALRWGLAHTEPEVP